MYIIRDSVTPKINEYIQAQAFKNCMIRYWPTHTVNGQIVFDTLYTWTSGQGVIQDDSHMRIYNQLSMTVKTISSQNHSSLDNTSLYLKASSAPLGTITVPEVQSYIEQFSPLIYPNSKDVFNPVATTVSDTNPDIYKNTTDALWDNSGWITVGLIYQPTSTEQIDNNITDTQILSKIGDVNSIGEIAFDVHNASRLTALAMLDIGTNSVFETQLYVSQRNITTKTVNLQSLNIGKYNSNKTQQEQFIVSVNITLKFRRVTDVNVGSPSGTLLTYLTKVMNTANNIYTTINTTAPITTIYGKTNSDVQVYKNSLELLHTSMNQQLAIMCNWVNTYQGNELIVVNDPTSNDNYYANSSPTSITVNGLSALHPIEFKKEFLKLLTPGYHVHKNKGHWYDVVVEILIVIIAIVVAVASDGALIGAYSAMVLSIASIAEVGWAIYLSKNGGSPGAIQTALGISQVLGIVAMVDVFAAGFSELMKQLETKELSLALLKAAAEEVGSGIALASQTGLVNKNIGMIAGIVTMGIEGVAELGANISGEAAKESISLVDKIEKAIQDQYGKFIAKPLSEIMNSTINMMNTMFHAYMSLVNPEAKFDSSYKDKLAILQDLETKVENTNPENSENMWKTLNDPYASIFEVTDYIDRSYPMMVEGLNQNLMNQCYYSKF